MATAFAIGLGGITAALVAVVVMLVRGSRAFQAENGRLTDLYIKEANQHSVLKVDHENLIITKKQLADALTLKEEELQRETKTRQLVEKQRAELITKMAATAGGDDLVSALNAELERLHKMSTP